MLKVSRQRRIESAIIRDRHVLARIIRHKVRNYISALITAALTFGFLIATPISASALTVKATGTNPSMCNQDVTNTTGVSVERIGTACVISFTSTGSNAWSAPVGVTSIRVLVVGGGGAGGVGDWTGGGGAGSVLLGNAYPVSAGTSYPLTIGAGGVGAAVNGVTANPGSNSDFGAWIAAGGGGGAGYGWGNDSYFAAGGSGGSGGGAAEENGTPSGGAFVQLDYSGAQKFGNKGGDQTIGNGSQAGAGGGGAGSAGGNAGNRVAGAGGASRTFDLLGKNFTVAGGGGGSTLHSPGGGLGGGGLGGAGATSGPGFSGLVNTGSGGGAGMSGNGGNGGSGLVVVAYTIPAGLPSAPSSMSVSAAIGALTVSWIAPVDEAGRSRTGYQVEHSTTGVGGWTTASSTVAANATSFQITGLIAGTNYYVRAAARYSSGESGAYGYPWTKVYGTTNPLRNSSGNIVYESGFGLNGTGVAAHTNTTFSRVRYLMKSTYGGQANYVDADFAKAITSSPTSGFPASSLNSVANLQVPSTGSVFPSSQFVVQGNVSDLTVLSNVSTALQNGFGYSGRLELWPWNYWHTANGNLPARDLELFDDSDSSAVNGDYGSFQLHSVGAEYKKNIFSWNRHSGTPDIGFGDFGGAHPDWTFCNDGCSGRTNFGLETFINSPVTPLTGSALTPTFGAPTPTANGYTVQISNYDAAFTWTGTATASGIVLISGSGLVTVSGVAPNTSSTATITSTRQSYTSGSATVSGTSTTGAARTPTFGTPTATADGFTVTITNYDAAFTWNTPTVSAGSVSAGSPSGANQVLTVTGLTPGTSATITQTTARTGYNNGTATVSGTALAAALTPTFGTPTRTSDGFTVQISNYDAAFTWAGTATASGSVVINDSGLVTVNGVAANTQSVATINTTRAGYVSGSATVSGTALVAALTPTFGTPTATADGFTVTITNYDAAFTWNTPTVSIGSVSAGAPSGANQVLTVTGLTPGTSATITQTTARTGYNNGSATVSGTALAVALTPTFGTPTRTSDGFTVQISNYDAAFTWAGTVTPTGSLAISSIGLITVTGVGAGSSSTVTVTTTGGGYLSGSAFRVVAIKVVTYNAKSGTAVADGSYVVGGSIATAPVSTWAGYTLAGWSATDGGTVVMFPYSPGVTTDITLFAIWTTNTPAPTTSPTPTPSTSPTVKPSTSPTSLSPTPSVSPEVKTNPAAPVTQFEELRNAPYPGNGLNTPTLGEIITLINRVPVQLVVTNQGAQTLIEFGDAISMVITSRDASGAPVATDASGLIKVFKGTSIQTSGAGFLANSPVEVWLYSTPTRLGSGNTSSDGTFEGTFEISFEIPIGEHTIVLNGMTPDNEIFTVALGIQVSDQTAATALDENESSAGASQGSTPFGLLGGQLDRIVAVLISVLTGIILGLLARRRRNS